MTTMKLQQKIEAKYQVGVRRNHAMEAVSTKHDSTCSAKYAQERASPTRFKVIHMSAKLTQT